MASSRRAAEQMAERKKAEREAPLFGDGLLCCCVLLLAASYLCKM